MFVKPVVYVIELIFGMVVTFGTADKFLIPNRKGFVCKLNSHRNAVSICISVIILGFIAVCILFITLRRRLIAAFDVDYKFTHSAEAQICLLVSLLWLVVASLVSSVTRIDKNDKLNGEKIVTLVFSWLLVFLCTGSAAVAWLVFEYDEPPPPPPTTKFSSHSPTPSPETSGLQMMPSLPRTVDEFDSETSTLMRRDAAREKDEPDTSVINSKLTEWERVTDGPPPRDHHADALASAERIPLSAMPPRLGLRRRHTAALRTENVEDEITPLVTPPKPT